MVRTIRHTHELFLSDSVAAVMVPGENRDGRTARYRKDGAKRYEKVESGLNRMSLRKFERLIGASGLKAARIDYVGVKKMHILTRIRSCASCRQLW